MGLVKNYDYDAVRKITCQDALEIAEDAERRNLVPTYIPMEGDENWLCFCCKCCCIPIEQFIACGKSMLPSDFVQFTDEDACIACGDCLPACQFSARILENDKLLIQEPRCLGCGVCIDDCPQDAISLISRI
jgi:ferredoxin